MDKKMKVVLVAEEKDSTRIFDVSTEELKNKAVLKLFNERKKERCYTDLIEVDSNLYHKACNGDAKAAIRILWYKSDCEYERVYEIEVE